MFHRSTIFITVFIACFIFSGSVILQRGSPNKQPDSFVSTSTNEFVGDQSCKNCHAKENNEWLQSHHFMAMQPPNDSTVKGDFNNATLTADGVTSRFFKKDNHYFINTQGDDGSNHDYEVKFIFGFTPLQQYKYWYIHLYFFYPAFNNVK